MLIQSPRVVTLVPSAKTKLSVNKFEARLEFPPTGLFSFSHFNTIAKGCQSLVHQRLTENRAQIAPGRLYPWGHRYLIACPVILAKIHSPRSGLLSHEVIDSAFDCTFALVVVVGHCLCDSVPQPIVVDDTIGVECGGFWCRKLYLSLDHTSAVGSCNAKPPVTAFVDGVGGYNLAGVSVHRLSIPPTSSAIRFEANINYRWLFVLHSNYLFV